MSVLYRYLLTGNLYFIALCLGLGAGLYILADIFERLDNFTNAGIGFGRVLFYFLTKLPLILSQIMPAVFLIACVVQLSLMDKKRELLALQVSGISLMRILKFMLLYSLLWAVFQMAFSQIIGVPGEQTSGRIWREEVQKREQDRSVIKRVWFKDGPYVVNIRQAKPAEGTGEGVVIYQLGRDRLSLEKTYSAASFVIRDDEWTFYDVQVYTPDDFSQESRPELTLPRLRQDLNSFIVISRGGDPSQLPLWQLKEVISQLRTSGANVEALRTLWHMRFAYAASMIIMGLISLTIITFGFSLYVNVPVAFVLIFIYYGMFMFGVSAAEKAVLSPIVGAWGANVIFVMICLVRLAHYLRPDLAARLKTALLGRLRGQPA